MSERTYAPRSGGRTGERNDSGVPAARGARGARREPGRDNRARTQGTSALKLDTAVAEPQRVTTAQPKPQLRVAPPAPISAPRAPFVAVMIAVTIAGVLGILLVNTKTNENSFEIRNLQDQQTVLDNQQQQLENQLANYSSVGNLDALAKAQGLVKGDPAMIRLPDGQIIGVPKPATGAPAVTAQDEADAKAEPNKAQPNKAEPNADQPNAGQGQPNAGQPNAGQPNAGQGQGQPGTTGQVAPNAGR